MPDETQDSAPLRAETVWESSVAGLEESSSAQIQRSQPSVPEEQSIKEKIIDWGLGAVGGAFIDDQTLGQIVVDTVLSAIPGLDKIAGFRDLTAYTYRFGWLQQYTQFDKWVGLSLTLVGLIPAAGSVLKGIGKSAVSFLRGMGKSIKQIIKRGLFKLGEPILELFKHVQPLVTISISTRDISKLKDFIRSSWSAIVREAKTRWNSFINQLIDKSKEIATGLEHIRDGIIQRLGNVKELSRTWLSEALAEAQHLLDELLGQFQLHPQLVPAGVPVGYSSKLEPTLSPKTDPKGRPAKIEPMQMSAFSDREILEEIVSETSRGKPHSVLETRLATDAPLELSLKQFIERFGESEKLRLKKISISVEKHHSFFKYLLKAISLARKAKGIPRHTRLIELEKTAHQALHALFDRLYPGLVGRKGAATEIAESIRHGKITPGEIADILEDFYKGVAKKSPKLLPKDAYDVIVKVIDSIRRRGNI